MIERIALLARQDQPALGGTIEGSKAVAVGNTMTLARRQHGRRKPEPLLDCDHITAGKSLLFLPVLAQGHNIA